MEATEREEMHMSILVFRALDLLRETEQVAGGKLVRVTLQIGGQYRDAEVMQPRVAAYLLQAVGEALPTNDNGASIEFADNRHATGSLFLSQLALMRVMQAWIAWSKADRRRLRREIAQCKQMRNDLLKGGAAL